MTLLLGESHLKALVSMRDLIPLMEETLAAFSTGGAVQPVRTAVPVARYGGFLGVMPAYLAGSGAGGAPEAARDEVDRRASRAPSHDHAGGDDVTAAHQTDRGGEALGLKAVAFYPDNGARGLPTHLATILLLDPGTGALLAVLDGRWITGMRTAAVSAAATAHLARPDARVLALLGAGVQARSHLEALREVRTLAEVRVWSRTRESAERFAAEMRERFGSPVTVAGSAADAVRGADLVCTVTASTRPVLHGAWLAPGAHINAVGAPRPDWRELDTGAVRQARVFVDSRAAAAVEAGDLVGPMQEGAITETHIQAEIGEVFAGRRPGRTGSEDVTLFKSLGLAVEDVATARFAYEQARARKVGAEITLD